jgi:dTDP-glucose 4,6-dehydratase
MRIVVTGGLGFIGSSFVDLCVSKGIEVLVIDKMTYASNEDWLPMDTELLVSDICDVTKEDLGEYDYLVNFAAESHVDRSIKDGLPFVKSNIQGTYNLLELARKNPKLKKFVQISTDEVYGDLEFLFVDEVDETHELKPSSYYSSTKASADLIVQSCGHTYGLPYLITRTCNNFGIRQHSEKFIPTIIDCIKNKKQIPMYGNGKQVREWIWVEDNVRQVFRYMLDSDEGIRNIGSKERLTNKHIIQKVGEILNTEPLITSVEDRLGHDRRYGLKTNYKETPITKTLFEYVSEVK